MTSIEALQKICGYYYQSPEYNLIAKELGLLNALRNKLNRKVETKEYKDEANNSYHITTLLTYELKEHWYDIELEALREFLLNLSGISKSLKALEIVKNKVIPFVSIEENCVTDLDAYRRKELTKEESDLLKEVLL